MLYYTNIRDIYFRLNELEESNIEAKKIHNKKSMKG